MKIGIMLRHLGQHGGGVLVYTHYLLRELLSLDSPHQFVLLYDDPRNLGSYSNGDRVKELAFRAPHVLVWDQVMVRMAERSEKFDVLFNPKYSLPLTARCKTMFVLHGLDWYVMPWGSRWFDRINHRIFIPRYCRKADGIIAITQTVKNHTMQFLKVAPERIHTIYYGVDERFKQTLPPSRLEQVRRQYGLPEQFLLYSGQIYPPKNFGRILKAYARTGPEQSIPLVVAGEHRWLSEKELAEIDRLNLSKWVIRPGWIDHEIMPAFYQSALALVFPSLYEGFGMPILEAMASGTPVITSNRHAPRELAEGAGMLVDPESVESIADGIRKVLKDVSLRQEFAAAGRKRAAQFTWSKCARQTLTALESIGG